APIRFYSHSHHGHRDLPSSPTRRSSDLIQGEVVMPYLQARKEELDRDKGLLRRQRQEILNERKAILRDYTDETELLREFAFLGAVRGWIISNREWSLQRLAWQAQLEQVMEER